MTEKKRTWNRPCSNGCGRICNGKTGMCRTCWKAALPPPAIPRYTGPCKNDCGKHVVRSRSGFCHPCFMQHLNTDPEWTKKRVEELRKVVNDPTRKELRSKRAKRAARTRWNNPEYAAKVLAALARIQQLSVTPENMAKRDYRRIGASISRSKLPWCPDEFKPRYHYLTKSRNMKSAEARAIVEAEIAEANAKKADEEALKHVSSALEHLRHYAPVQVLENGYRYGNAILRPSEVVKRAELRGWQPEEWAA